MKLRSSAGQSLWSPGCRAPRSVPSRRNIGWCRGLRRPTASLCLRELQQFHLSSNPRGPACRHCPQPFLHPLSTAGAVGAGLVSHGQWSARLAQKEIPVEKEGGVQRDAKSGRAGSDSCLQRGTPLPLPRGLKPGAWFSEVEGHSLSVGELLP